MLFQVTNYVYFKFQQNPFIRNRDEWGQTYALTYCINNIVV